jgi:peptidoglycan/xylan/chitin deacetylase (PgdA/CDA1 family)
MYHRVDVSSPGDRISRALTVSPKQFDGEMALLARRGFTAVSFDRFYELARAGKPLDRLVLVTFDDGYSDQYQYAVPILERYHFGGTFFVNTGTIGDSRHMSWQELQTKRTAGMSIEAHGVDHVDLAELSPAQQTIEIDRCVQTLELRLASPVRAFAYPSGAFDLATVGIVRQAGVAFAFTTDAFRTLQPGSPYELARVRVASGLDDREFNELLPAPK